MSPMFKIVMLSLIIATGFVCLEDSLQARESRGMDDLATFNSGVSKEAKACASITYSKDFDDWSNYYLAGNMEKSDLAWSKVLVQAKGVESINILLVRAIPRLLFADIPKGSPLKKVELRTVFKQWLRVAKAKLGVNHRFVGDSYATMANYYEGQKIYRNAAMYRKKQFEVYEKSFGATSRTAIHALYYCANNLFLGKDYLEAEKTLKQVLKLCDTAKYTAGTRESVKLYLTLLKNTNKESQAKNLTDKYKRYI